jgi:hypothetical protein
MRLVLCHECWSWIGATGMTCPDCHAAVDITVPDPAAADLASQFGAGIVRIGIVRLDRRNFPPLGSLIGTTRGLMYVPFLHVLPDGGLAPHEDSRSQRNLWNWWRSSPASGAAEVTFALPAGPELSATALELVDAFLNAPGAIFLPRDHIHRLQLRGRMLMISRFRGATLNFSLRSRPEDWQLAWRQLARQEPPWKALLPL